MHPACLIYNTTAYVLAFAVFISSLRISIAAMGVLHAGWVSSAGVLDQDWVRDTYCAGCRPTSANDVLF